MQVRSAHRGVPIFATSVAGVLAGHWAAYTLALRDPHQRLLVLGRAGHDYLPLATKLALVLLFVGLGTVIARTCAARGERAFVRSSPPPGVMVSAARLMAIQAAAFGGIEVVERLVAGAPLTDLASEHLLLVGLAVQLIVAVIGALMLHAASRAGVAMASFLDRLRRPWPAAVFPLPRSVAAAACPALSGAAGARGPPAR